MNVFQEEVAERKKIASGARHKKGGSHSKTCHLSSDNLTNTQLKSLHGEVHTYQLGKPMDWATFRSMPTDLQKMYAEQLIEKYNVSNGRLADMLGISASHLSTKLNDIGIRRSRRQADFMTAEQVAAWAQFLAQNEK